MRFFKKKPTIDLTDARLHTLKEFNEVLVTNAVHRRERVELVNALVPAVVQPHVKESIDGILARMQAAYPDHNVDVNLLDDAQEIRLSHRADEVVKIDAVVPQQDSWCRYTVAAARPLEITDSLESLIVCDSPYVGVIRSYMGAPLIVRAWVVGVCCVYNDQPKDHWPAGDQQRLLDWASELSDILEVALIEGSAGS